MLRQLHVESRRNVKLANVLADSTLKFNLQKIVVRNFEYKKHLWLIGVDRNGFSVQIQVTDFVPTLMIRSPDSWPKDATEELDDFVEDLIAKTSTMQGNYERISHAEFVHMTPFIGFTNGRQDRLIKIFCNNLTDVKAVSKHLKESKHTLYHDDFDPSNQFMHVTDIAYQDWIQLSNVRYSKSQQTWVNIEGSTQMQHIKRLENEEDLPVFLKAFVRMHATSRDGIVDGQLSYQADPERRYDRLVTAAVSYAWSDSPKGEPFHQDIYTICPDENQPPLFTEGESKITTIHRMSDEQELMKQFRHSIIENDPDDVFYFPDEFQTWTYYVGRAELQQCDTALKLDRFKLGKMKSFRQGGVISHATIETRNLFDMEAALKKKVFISIEKHDLYTCSCHKKLRKKAEKLDDLLPRQTNYFFATDAASRQQLLALTLQDLKLLVNLEHDTGMCLEFANVSRASDTDLTDVVSRGEQIRVYNKLSHFCIQNSSYINREKLVDKPLRFRISERPPTFVDPAELPMNTALREECHAKLAATLNYGKGAVRTKLAPAKMVNPGKKRKLPDDEDAETKKHAKDAEEAEGGNVMAPAPNFWGDTKIFVDDFASLYPSIMMAFNISYENMVLDKQYLDLDGVKYIFVAVNKYETVAVADVPGIIPKMLKTFVDNRTRIRAKEETEIDVFKKAMLNFEQNSMKVLCNGTYGFCGAECKGSLLAMKTVMYVVTSLGRYLQKFCCTYAGTKYGIKTIYGDTDSIFTIYPPDGLAPEAPIEDRCQRVGELYDMKDFFGPGLPFDWAHVVNHYATRKKKPLDILTFELDHQINAIYYLVNRKICSEMSTAIGRPPVDLTFENLATKVYMNAAKKSYFYLFWDDKNPSKIEKVKVTGMPSKKREYAPFVRNLLTNISEMILYDREHEIQGYLIQELDKLVSGQVPMRDLMVSKKFKDKLAYKHNRLINVQVAEKIEKRTRWPVKEQSRLFLVIVKGKEKLYLRSETPEYAVEHNLPLDLGYYLQNQIYRPVKKTLVYHPHLFSWEAMYQSYMKKLQLKDTNQVDIGDLLKGGGAQRKKLTLESRIQKKSAPKEVVHQFAKKASMHNDPFARFLKK